jgi:hypothetical protein
LDKAEGKQRWRNMGHPPKIWKSRRNKRAEAQGHSLTAGVIRLLRGKLSAGHICGCVEDVVTGGEMEG